jgi:hypothetical protein
MGLVFAVFVLDCFFLRRDIIEKTRKHLDVNETA